MWSAPCRRPYALVSAAIHSHVSFSESSFLIGWPQYIAIIASAAASNVCSSGVTTYTIVLEIARCPCLLHEHQVDVARDQVRRQRVLKCVRYETQFAWSVRIAD